MQEEKKSKINFEKIIDKISEYYGVAAILFITIAFIIILNFSGEWGDLLPDFRNIAHDLGYALLLVMLVIVSLKLLFMYLASYGKTNLVVYYLTIVVYVILLFAVLSPIINFFIW